MNATFKFTFTTREEYLLQKKEWFAEYKKAINAIRNRKHVYKDWQRGKKTYADVSALNHVYSNLDALLSARNASRIEAQRQYVTAKEVVQS